ncbi:hypothetical protein BC749_1011121 [Flavobacterium araucananum]|uniref:Uncharacterized protein n=1 Tax=Flavobacterium araucananum TaxID=946678 RepID=A0A227P0N6_9FLAO|nr:hypothetical protein [Flavobacterium araucananum]OXG03093.1 hypothetical protein B0A64_18020 [Flavobacterium araucananum]PWK03034.1 hypothetical protein BC749_1011121 [Flavobacterium araucananum]
MFRDRFGENKNRNPFDNDIWERTDAIGEMLEARKSKDRYENLFSFHHNFFADGPNTIASEGELYFESKDNTIYRGNKDGSWTKATQLSEVVVRHLIGTLVQSDGIRVFGFGADPIAGSGNLGNDRGSGSINTPSHDFNTCIDLGYLLGKLFPNSSMMYPWLLEFELRLKYGAPNTNSSVSKNAISSDPEMILMPLYNYKATDIFGGNLSGVHEKKIKDTTVDPSQKDDIERINSRNRKEAEKEMEYKNREFQKKINNYKD